MFEGISYKDRPLKSDMWEGWYVTPDFRLVLRLDRSKWPADEGRVGVDFRAYDRASSDIVVSGLDMFDDDDRIGYMHDEVAGKIGCCRVGLITSDFNGGRFDRLMSDAYLHHVPSAVDEANDSLMRWFH